MATTNLRGTDGYQGMNWIRKAKRLAIYLRDGMACVWCGKGVEDSIRLTLDHVVCYSKGGSHDATNLVTSCFTCNSSRQDRTVATFAKAVANYRGVKSADLLRHINTTRRRVLDVKAAKALIAARGWSVASCGKVS